MIRKLTLYLPAIVCGVWATFVWVFDHSFDSVPVGVTALFVALALHTVQLVGDYGRRP